MIGVLLGVCVIELWWSHVMNHCGVGGGWMHRGRRQAAEKNLCASGAWMQADRPDHGPRTVVP